MSQRHPVRRLLAALLALALPVLLAGASSFTLAVSDEEFEETVSQRENHRTRRRVRHGLEPPLNAEDLTAFEITDLASGEPVPAQALDLWASASPCD